MAASWKQVDSEIFILETQVSFLCEWRHTHRKERIVLRIDGRDGSYRVDLYDPLLNYWEAKDGGRGFASVREAKVFASSWKSAVVVQGTLSPSVRS